MIDFHILTKTTDTFELSCSSVGFYKFKQFIKKSLEEIDYKELLDYEDGIGCTISHKTAEKLYNNLVRDEEIFKETTDNIKWYYNNFLKYLKKIKDLGGDGYDI